MRLFHPKKILRISTEKIKNFWFNYLLPDKVYLKYQYKKIFGKDLDLKTPKTFNEKIQWLKLYDRKPEYHKMVDKYEAKFYVGNLIGHEYIIPTLKVWEKIEDINLDELPDQFVLKCTHDAASTIICKDKKKFNFEEAKNKLKKALKCDYYHYENRQWAYKGIKPRIIAEQFMSEGTEGLEDYKFLVFNGKVKCSFVCSDRFNGKGLKVTFFDENWEKLPFERHYKTADNIPMPKNYHKMVSISEKLARNINCPFVRIDLYEINDKIFFGEITFYPGGGVEEFTPEEWDYKLGEWIELPLKS
jgi:hypothetical protein